MKKASIALLLAALIVSLSAFRTVKAQDPPDTDDLPPPPPGTWEIFNFYEDHWGIRGTNDLIPLEFQNHQYFILSTADYALDPAILCEKGGIDSAFIVMDEDESNLVEYRICDYLVVGGTESMGSWTLLLSLPTNIDWTTYEIRYMVSHTTLGAAMNETRYNIDSTWSGGHDWYFDTGMEPPIWTITGGAAIMRDLSEYLAFQIEYNIAALNYQSGYEAGYESGYMHGQAAEFDGLSWIFAIFGMFTVLFNIVLIPGSNITVGLIVGVPLVLGTFFFVLKMIGVMR